MTEYEAAVKDALIDVFDSIKIVRGLAVDPFDHELKVNPELAFAVNITVEPES